MKESSELTPVESGKAPHVPQRRTRVWRYAILLAFLAAEALYAVASRTRPELFNGPMVQFPAPNKLVLVWEMKAPFSTAVVTLLDRHGGTRSTTVEPVADFSRSDFKGITRRDAQRYEASFPDLAAGEEYTYVIENRKFLLWRDNVAGPNPVRTPPPRGKPFRFLAFGDSGLGNNTQYDLAEVMTTQKPDLIIHAGDLNQIAGAPTDYHEIFFHPYAAMIRSIPFMPILGNHDCATDSGQPLVDIFVLPENGPSAKWKERNYYFDFGDVRFVGLDANKVQDKQSGVMTPEDMKKIGAPWLREVLTNCDARWKIVYFHEPFYTGSNHAAEAMAYFKEAYVEVFEDCGVDLVFSGHNHLYERSAPIRRDQVVEEGKGVVYVTVGTGGAGRYAMYLPPPYYNRVFNDQSHGFSCVDVSADRLELREIGIKGQVLDRYVIDKSVQNVVQAKRPSRSRDPLPRKGS